MTRSSAMTAPPRQFSSSEAMLQGMRSLAAKRSRYYGMPDEAIMKHIQLLQEEIERAEEEARRYKQTSSENTFAAIPLIFLTMVAIPLPILAIFIAIPAFIFSNNAIDASNKQATQKRKALHKGRALAEAKAALGTEIKPEAKIPAIPELKPILDTSLQTVPETTPPVPTQLTVNTPQAGLIAGGLAYPIQTPAIAQPPIAPHTETKTEHYHSEKIIDHSGSDAFAAILKLIESMNFNSQGVVKDPQTIINNNNNVTHHHHHYYPDHPSFKDVTPVAFQYENLSHSPQYNPPSGNIYDQVGSGSLGGLYDEVGNTLFSPAPYPSQSIHPVISEYSRIVISNKDLAADPTGEEQLVKLHALAEKIQAEQVRLASAMERGTQEALQTRVNRLEDIYALEALNRIIKKHMSEKEELHVSGSDTIPTFHDYTPELMKQITTLHESYLDEIAKNRNAFTILIEHQKELLTTLREQNISSEMLSSYYKNTTDELQALQGRITNLEKNRSQEQIPSMIKVEVQLDGYQQMQETLKAQQAELVTLRQQLTTFSDNKAEQDRLIAAGIKKMEETIDSKYAEAEQKVTDRLTAIEKTLTSGLEKQKTEYELQLEALKAEHLKNYAALAADYAQKIEAMRSEQQSFQAKLTSQLSENDKKNQEETAGKIAELQEKLMAERVAYEKQVDGKHTELEGKIKALEEKQKGHESRLEKNEQTIKDLLSKLEQIEHDKEAEAKTVLTHLEAEIDEYKKLHTSTLEESKEIQEKMVKLETTIHEYISNPVINIYHITQAVKEDFQDIKAAKSSAADPNLRKNKASRSPSLAMSEFNNPILRHISQKDKPLERLSNLITVALKESVQNKENKNSIYFNALDEEIKYACNLFLLNRENEIPKTFLNTFNSNKKILKTTLEEMRNGLSQEDKDAICKEIKAYEEKNGLAVSTKVDHAHHDAYSFNALRRDDSIC